MQKAIYSITRLGKENTKFKGVGYITDEELITAQKSKDGKPYLRSYLCVKQCAPVFNGQNEFKGYFSELREIEVEKNNSYETIEVEINYFAWFKLIDDKS